MYLHVATILDERAYHADVVVLRHFWQKSYYRKSEQSKKGLADSSRFAGLMQIRIGPNDPNFILGISADKNCLRGLIFSSTKPSIHFSTFTKWTYHRNITGTGEVVYPLSNCPFPFCIVKITKIEEKLKNWRYCIGHWTVTGNCILKNSTRLKTIIHTYLYIDLYICLCNATFKYGSIGKCIISLIISYIDCALIKYNTYRIVDGYFT